MRRACGRSIKESPLVSSLVSPSQNRSLHSLHPSPSSLLPADGRPLGTHVSSVVKGYIWGQNLAFTPGQPSKPETPSASQIWLRCTFAEPVEGWGGGGVDGRVAQRLHIKTIKRQPAAPHKQLVPIRQL